VDYDFIHIVPPQSGPDFIKNSHLANAFGWVDTDKATLPMLNITIYFHWVTHLFCLLQKQVLPFASKHQLL
jgi:hypothetical protein